MRLCSQPRGNLTGASGYGARINKEFCNLLKSLIMISGALLCDNQNTCGFSIAGVHGYGKHGRCLT